ncbi:HNH endonuclease [Cronobacter sakazakii]|nr:HNH endonuclease [Cronobacter sakazakii]
MKQHHPDVAYLYQCFDHNEVDGTLTWKVRPQEHFKNARSCSAWNARFSGKRAGGPNNGYMRVEINKKPIGCHSVIWAMTHGCYPSGMIDHINGDRSDNRLINLRVTDYDGNAKNQRVPRNNKSGAIGVHWNIQIDKWMASIRVSNKLIHLGCFDDIDDAVSARKKAEVEYGFHPNHGRNFSNEVA